MGDDLHRPQPPQTGEGRALSPKPTHTSAQTSTLIPPRELVTRTGSSGSNDIQWVSHSADAAVHTASGTWGAVVVREMMDGHKPAVWISDRYTAQQAHAAKHQTCLAHFARDVAYVVETSDDPVLWRLQLWLQSMFALTEPISDLAASRRSPPSAGAWIDSSAPSSPRLAAAT